MAFAFDTGARELLKHVNGVSLLPATWACAAKVTEEALDAEALS